MFFHAIINTGSSAVDKRHDLITISLLFQNPYKNCLMFVSMKSGPFSFGRVFVSILANGILVEFFINRGSEIAV